MKYTVRPAHAGDEAVIENLLYEICEQHRKSRPDLFRKSASKYSKEQLVKMFCDEKMLIYVAVDSSDSVCGYIMCEIKGNNGAVLGDYKTLYIDDLNIDGSCRRAGLGTMLTDAVVAEARQLGCHNITLNVWEFNTGAMKFYENYGFQVQRRFMEIIL